MRNHRVRVSEFSAFLRNPSPQMESAVKGQFYELYCYNELVKNNMGISIIKSNYVERKSKGSFNYSKDGKIMYSSKNLFLAEFDVLGLKENEIYWWEITKSNKIDNKSIKRKMYLLKELFKNMTINFTLIVPKIFPAVNNYNYLIIEEPDYSEYFEKGFFKFDKIISKCITLNALNKLASDYDYIDEVITLSYEYYRNNAHCNIDKMKENYLVNYVYNLDNLNTGKFEYYDIKDDKNGIIEITEKNRIILDGEISNTNSKVHNEIILIKKRLEYTFQ